MNCLGRDTLLVVLSDLDPEGTESFTQSQVRRIVQTARERRRQQRLTHEARIGRQYDFEPGELADLRSVFRQFDADFGGFLDRQEVKKAMDVLRVAFKRDTYFDSAFRTLDEDS